MGGARPLLTGVHFLIRHGERFGLIGPNGSGKPVLLRLILGVKISDAGEIKLGPNISTGYYAQERDTLDLDKTLLDTVRRAGNLSESTAVTVLLGYLFSYPTGQRKGPHAFGLGTLAPATGAAGAFGSQLPAAVQTHQQSRHRLRRSARKRPGGLHRDGAGHLA